MWQAQRCLQGSHENAAGPPACRTALVKQCVSAGGARLDVGRVGLAVRHGRSHGVRLDEARPGVSVLGEDTVQGVEARLL